MKKMTRQTIVHDGDSLTFVDTTEVDKYLGIRRYDSSALTPVDKAEADKYIQKYGRSALANYLSDLGGDKERDLKLVKHFIFQGVDMNAGNTPSLHWATENGHIEIVSLLVSNGANVNVQDCYNGTPLHIIALGFGTIEIAQLLISRGADVNAKNKNGNTPLHNAVQNRTVEVVRLLVSKGADVNAKNKNGNTPTDIAHGQNRDEIMRILQM